MSKKSALVAFGAGRVRGNLRLAAVSALAAVGLSFAGMPGTAISTADVMVNTTVALAQTVPAVARDADGDAVVVWQSVTGSDTGDVFLQRYGSNGAAAGAETRVNTTIADLQGNPATAMDAAGNFVVVWESNLQDGAGTGVYAQRYNAAGTRQGSEFRVNTTTALSQNAPAVAMAPGGSFVVVWEGQDSGGRGIFLQRYAADGTAQGVETGVNTTVAASQKFPAIAMDAAGNFVVAWQSNNQDGDLNGIYAQRYTAAAATVGSEFRLNQITAGEQTAPALALRADGSFTAAWVGDDTAATGIYARRFDASNQALDASEVLVNRTVAGIQDSPAVSVDTDGDAVIAWQSNGQDGSGYGIYFQRFGSDGVPAGAEDVRVNRTTALDQKLPAIATDADGDYLIAWQGTDSDDAGIFLQRFVGPEAVDLEITQTDSSDPAAPSPALPPIPTTLVYNLTVVNKHAASTGTSVAALDQAIGAATTVKVVDTLPSEVTFVSATGTGWTCAAAGRVVTCTYAGSYKAQTSSTIAITVNMPTAAPDGNRFSNVATVSADQTDPVTDNNTDTETTNVCGTNDDVGSFTIVDGPGDEGATGMLTVRRTPAAGSALCGPASINFASEDGTAKAGIDYTAVSGTLNFSDSSTNNQVQTMQISIPVAADELDEDAETVNVRLSQASIGTIGRAVGVLTVADKNDPPTATLSEASATVDESAGTHSFDVVLDHVSGREVKVPYTTSGSATKGSATSDYTLSPDAEVTIPAGSTTASLTVNVVDDTRDEIDETVVVELTAPGTNATYQKGAEAKNTVTITDNDSPPSVSFAAATSSQAEGGTRQVVVTLSTVSGKQLTIPYSVGGSATPGDDFDIPPPATVVFNAGETSKNIAVTVKTDTINEPSETVVLTFGTLPEDVTPGTTTSHTLTITDGNTAPTVSFTVASQSVAENVASNTATIVARLSAASGQEISVPYSISGTATKDTDYSLSPNSPLTFEIGQTEVTITATLVDDALNEPNETVVLTLNQPTNATLGSTPTHTLTIGNDDPLPVVEFTKAAQSVREDLAGGSTTIDVKLSAVSGQEVTVPYSTSGSATNGSDYTLNPTASLKIPAGSTMATITVAVTNDGTQESDETAVVSIGTPTNASKGTVSTHTVTIVDDDALPQVFFDAASQGAEESAGTLSALVKLSRPADRDVTVRFSTSGTANNGADYTVMPASTLVIAEGETSGVVSVAVTDDHLIETNETIVLRLDSATGATLLAPTEHTITVADNDQAGVTVTQSGGNTNVTEGGATDSYTLVLDAQPTADVTVSLSQDSQISTSPATTVVFTSANWNQPQTVTVTAVDDAAAEGDQTVSIDHSVSSSDMQFDGRTVASVPVNITDNDVASVSVVESGGATTVTEGGATDSYTMVLSSQPTADVTVTVMPDSQLSVDKTSIVFTSANWNVPQTVTVTAFDDRVAEGAHRGSIAHRASSTDQSFNGVNVRTLEAQVADNDTVGLVLSKSSVSVTEGGATETYTVQLKSQPTQAVTVSIDVGGQLRVASGATASQMLSITFTPNTGMPGGWDVAQTVTVSAFDDSTAEGNHSGMIVHATSSDDDAYDIAMAGNINAAITDNDSAGVSVTPTAVAVTEGGAGASYAVSLTSEPTADVVIAIASNNGEVLLSPTQLTFTAANWSQAQTVSVTAKDDAVAEGSHSSTIQQTVSSVDATYKTVTAPSVTATITDNDAAGIVIVESGGETSATEGGAGDSYTVKLNSQPTADVTVTLSQTPTGQLTTAPTSLTFTTENYAIGQLVSVSAVDDATVDGDVNVTVRHMAASTDSRYQGVSTDVLAKALDNDATVSLSPASKSISEAETSVSYVVQRVGASNQAATVAYATDDGSAKAGEDYTAANGTVRFAAGETEKTVSIVLTPDTVDESDETFTLTLANPGSNLVLGTPASATTTITDDDGSPSLSIGNATVAEGDSGTVTASFTVTLSAASGQTVTVAYATANGTATAGSDYTAKAGTLSFAPGVTTQTLDVVVAGDTLDEADETFSVALSAPTNATLDTQSTGTGTITDDDGSPSLSIGNAMVTEGNSGTTTASFTVTLSEASGQAVTVAYATANGTATAGSDYVASSGTLTFAPGSSSQTIDVLVNGDTLNEPSETFTLALSDPSNATLGTPSTGTGTITDDDGSPSLSIGNATVVEGNSGTATANFTVSLSAASGQTVTVAYATANGTATAGSDYTAQSGTLSFAPGVTTQTIAVSVTGDVIDEADETFTVVLSGPTNATLGTPSTGTGTITDDDAASSLSIGNATVVEGNSGTVTATFTVALSAPSAQTVTVAYATANGTAIAGSDYTAKSGTLTFAPGVTSQTIAISVTGDVTDEADETFTVVLSGATNASIATGTGTGTITDDDAAGVVFTQSEGSTRVTEGGATDSYTLVLASQPTADVTIAVNVGNQLTVTPTSLVFTAGNWNQPRTVTVTAVDDSVAEGNHTASLGHTASSTDSRYNGIAVAGTTVAITDNDTSRVTVNDPSGRPVQAESSSGVVTATPSPTPSSAPSSFEYRNGFYDIRVTGVDPGATVVVTLTLPAGSNPSAYIKCKPDGTGCAQYSRASISGNVIRITLTDGGVGDDDGVANGQIRDPGAPAYTPAPPASNGGGGGGSMPMALLLFLMAAAGLRRRVRAGV